MHIIKNIFDYNTGLHINGFQFFFFTVLGVFIAIQLAEFRHAKVFPLSRTVFPQVKMNIQEDLAE